MSHCGFHHIQCMKNIRAKISGLMPPKDSVGFDYVANYSDIGLECDQCLPDCDFTVSIFLTESSNK